MSFGPSPSRLARVDGFFSAWLSAVSQLAIASLLKPVIEADGGSVLCAAPSFARRELSAGSPGLPQKDSWFRLCLWVFLARRTWSEDVGTPIKCGDPPGI